MLICNDRGSKAVGLEYVEDTILRPNADQTPQKVFGSKLVVIAAGTFGSPTIPERYDIRLC